MRLLSKLLIFLFCWVSLQGFDKVVIWGHKLHSHTHSYIHKGFYDAFRHLGCRTYWLDNKDDVRNIDFSNALFLTEGQVDQNIPLRDDGIYILHNCTSSKYEGLKKLNLQVYTDDALLNSNAVQIAPFIYFDLPGQCLYMPWATNLLPDQIDQVKLELPHIKKVNEVYWIGTINDGYYGNQHQLKPFMRACKQNKIPFTCPNPLGAGISEEKHQKLIKSAYLAPAIVGDWQQRVGYIPCRVFKNVSYGQMGVTNSRHVYELFEGKIVYNPNTYQLFYDAKERLKTTTLNDIYELMDFVKAKHTYISRIYTLFECLKSIGYLNEADWLAGLPHPHSL